MDSRNGITLLRLSKKTSRQPAVSFRRVGWLKKPKPDGNLRIS